MNKAINIKEKSKNIQLYQNIIILIMLFAPFTSLRFLRIGVTESLSMILLLFVLLSKYKIKIYDNNTFIFTKFWVLFLSASGIGLFYNYTLMSTTSGTVEGMLFDILSYIIVFLTCLSLEMIIYNKLKINIDYILYKIFICSSLVLMILFIISQFTTSIVGYNLLDGADNFRPLASNIHHVAMFVVPLPFLGLYYLKNKYNNTSVYIYTMFIISNIIIVFNVGSDKAIMGFYLGSIIILLSLLSNKVSKTSKMYLYPIITIIFLIIVIVNYEYLSGIIVSVFSESDGEGARQSLYTTAFYESTNSPIFGYGPGQHIPWIGGGFADTHSTFLTVLLQGGIIGVILFVILLIKLVNKFKWNPFIMAAFSSIFIYITGGDILRRLPIWIYLILFFYKVKSDSMILSSKTYNE